jgi:hypothetical protein
MRYFFYDLKKIRTYSFIKQIYKDAFQIINIFFNKDYFFKELKNKNFDQVTKFFEKISKYITNKFFVEIDFTIINLIVKS